MFKLYIIPSTISTLARQFILGAGIVGLLSSCFSARKLAYFQQSPATGDTLPAGIRYVPTIQPGDLLSVQISSLNPEATAFFNHHKGEPDQPALSNTTPLPAANGYLVDPTGGIELPLIGKINLKNQTVSGAADAIREKLKVYLKEPTVNVRNLNFRISVLGEVAKPSLFTIPTEQITLLEALSMAGDITIYGRRDDVMIIREEAGQRTFTRVDLTSRNLFRSPHYYLHANDVVYVEPGKARVASADRLYLMVPLITGVLTSVVLLISRN